MTRRIKIFLWFIGTYLTVVGVVTFSLFIHEEAIQTAIWGTWPAQDAKQWHLVKDGITLIEGINFSMKVINYSFGWIQPLACIAYHQYAKATDYYIASLKAKVFANSPELFIGEKVKFVFYPKQIENLSDGTRVAVNRNIAVAMEIGTATTKKMLVEGVLTQRGRLLFVEQEGN